MSFLTQNCFRKKESCYRMNTSHGLGIQPESCKKKSRFPTILGLGAPPFKNHSTKKEVYHSLYLHRSTRQIQKAGVQLAKQL